MDGAAAKFVVDKYVKPHHTVGLGTGLAVNAVVEELARRIDSGALQGVRCVPASAVTASEAAFHGVPLTTQAEAGNQVDLLLEVADELDGCDPELSFIAGRTARPQQPQLARARQLVAAAATCVVLVQSPEQVVSRLGGDLPVVVEEEGWEETGEELDDIFIVDAEIWRRSLLNNADPRGGDRPYVSPEGHNILDIKFYEGLKLLGEDVGYGQIVREIEGVRGVVTHGLYTGVAAAAVVASEDGPVELLRGSPLSVASAEE
ncbi:hypothetical protein N2152v2_010713 [Parachlorella kessleri]